MVSDIHYRGAMIRRFALFVDTGYLMAAGGWAVTGKYRRHESECESVALVNWLMERATGQQPDKELLRLYWYDAAPNRQPTDVQLEIAEQRDTKLRLGHLTAQGTQKGVDAMLLSDLTTLARERSIDTAILLAGDGDFVEAVNQAQQHGCRVLLWAITTPQNTLSPDLRREADRVEMLTSADLTPFFKARPAPPPRPSAAPATTTAGTNAPPQPSPSPSPSPGGELPVYATMITDEALRVGRAFAQQWGGLAADSERRAVLEGEPRIPGELDFRLIRFALDTAELAPDTRLAQDALRTLREGFWAGLAAME